MKKKNFISLVFGTVGGLLFSIGMCMCLLPQWNAFNEGCVVSAIGAICLLTLLIVRRKIDKKPKIKINWKTVRTVSFGIFGALVLGLGMSMIMVFEGVMIQGLIVGIVGIFLLLCLIPMTKDLN